MSDTELFLCRHCTAGEDADGIMIPWCSLNDLSCDDVLRYGDEGCRYETEKARLREQIVETGYVYHPPGKKGVKE